MGGDSHNEIVYGVIVSAVQDERAASTKNRQPHMTIGVDFYPEPDRSFGLHGGVEHNVISMPVLLAAEDAFAEGSINIDTSSAGGFSDVMESTKRQLTTLIEWAKLIPCFIGLHLDDQVRLLKCTWSELLMLRMATRYSPMEDTLVLGSGRALHRYIIQTLCYFLLEEVDLYSCDLGNLLKTLRSDV